jgi:hypothetical protein
MLSLLTEIYPAANAMATKRILANEDELESLSKERMSGKLKPNLSFSEQMIEDITEKEMARYDGETGEVISSNTKYYRMTKDKKPVEITKDQALKEVKEYKEKKKVKEKEKTVFSDKNNTFNIGLSLEQQVRRK